MRKSHKFKEVIFRVIICNICIAIFLLSLLIIRVQQAYAQDVTEEWVARYNGPGDYYDGAGAIAIDSYGNVYVTGISAIMGTYDADYATVSYDSSGNERWVARYNERAYKVAGISIDSFGNVYVTGTSFVGSGLDKDYATVSYDSSGNERWVTRYNGPANSYDVASSIVIDPSGNVYVTGYSSGGPYSYVAYATVSYDSSGNQRWVARYSGSPSANSRADAIAIDSSGNVYVTGVSGSRITTVSYDSSGNQRWVARYDELVGYTAVVITTDSFGSVCVAGSIYSGAYTPYDYATVSYDLSGNQQWVARYNGTANDYDFVYAIAADPYGNVYVTGGSYNNEGSSDYATISYDQSGRERWVAKYNGTANDYYDAYAVATDSSGNVYVTGSHYSDDTGKEYATVSYDLSGNLRWVARYNATGDGDNIPFAIAVDTSGNVYVTGESLGYVNDTYSYDYATIKYSQIPEAPCSLIITSPNEGDIFCAGQEITFTAVTTPVGYEHLIQWGGGGEPVTGTSASFTTRFSTDGERTITASCGGSSVTRTVTVLPETSNCEFIDFSRKIPLKPVENILRKIPGVDEVETSISAGAEMCDCCYLGAIIERGEVSGSFGANLNASWDIPTRLGIPWHTKKPIQVGPYKVTGSGKIGIIITASGNANGSGTVKQECNTELCVKGPFGIEGTITAEATFKAELCAEGPMVPKWCWELELTLGTLSTGVTGKYELDTCGENKWELCWNGIEHERKFKIEIKDWSTEAGIKVTLVEEKCWPQSE